MQKPRATPRDGRAYESLSAESAKWQVRDRNGEH